MMKFKKIAVLGLVGLFSVLQGCNAFYPQANPNFETRQVLVTIGPDTDFQDYAGVRLYGISMFHDVGSPGHSGLSNVRECTIFLREYPFYLAHEMRHCFEGAFHGTEYNSDDWN